MKIFKYTAGAILFATVCVSCDDILDQIPRDKVTPDTFFYTAADLKLFTDEFYPAMIPAASNLYQGEYDAIIEAPMPSVVTGQRTVPSENTSMRRWGWEDLRQINFFLANSYRCEDETARKQYEGVACFFRALFYSYKLIAYGDVPWYDTALGSADAALYKPRDSREYVMQKVLEDLDYAIANLPPEKNVYRVTRWSAMALKSRMCLFEGTFRKYHGLDDWRKYLEDCAEVSELLIDTGGYSLYTTGPTPYQDFFASLNAIGSEVILARDYNASLSMPHNMQGFLNSQGTANNGLTKRMVDAYLMSDGTPFSRQPGWQTMDFYDEVQNRDPRLTQSIRTPGGALGLGLPNFNYNKTGYHLTKFYVAPKYDGGGSSENDIPIFRIAETYLNFAEAKAELGTLTQADLDKSVGLVRSRVGMPGLNMTAANAAPDDYLLAAATGYPGVDKGANKGVILEIRRERGVELIMEGLRFTDLLRWKEGAGITQQLSGMYFPGPGEYDIDRNGSVDVCLFSGTRPSTTAAWVWEIGSDVTLSNGTSGNLVVPIPGNYKWNEQRDYFEPIPSGERILNNSLTQNPGWNDGLNF